MLLLWLLLIYHQLIHFLHLTTSYLLLNITSSILSLLRYRLRACERSAGLYSAVLLCQWLGLLLWPSQSKWDSWHYTPSAPLCTMSVRSIGSSAILLRRHACVKKWRLSADMLDFLFAGKDSGGRAGLWFFGGGGNGGLQELVRIQRGGDSWSADDNTLQWENCRESIEDESTGKTERSIGRIMTPHINFKVELD